MNLDRPLSLSGSLNTPRPVDSLDHQPPAAPEKEEGTLGGRTVTALAKKKEKEPTLVCEVCNKTNALFKGLKFVGGLITVSSLYVGEGARILMKGVSRELKEVEGIIGFAQLAERISFFTEKKYLSAKNTVAQVTQVVSAAFIVVGKTAEAVSWFAVRGVLDLAQLARSIGGTPLFTFTRQFALLTVKNICVAIAAASTIIGTAYEVAKDKTASFVKPGLTFIEETGKIALCLGTRFAATTPFAFLALMTGTAGFAKICYGYYTA